MTTSNELDIEVQITSIVNFISDASAETQTDFHEFVDSPFDYELRLAFEKADPEIKPIIKRLNSIAVKVFQDSAIDELEFPDEDMRMMDLLFRSSDEREEDGTERELRTLLEKCCRKVKDEVGEMEAAVAILKEDDLIRDLGLHSSAAG